MRDSLSRCRRTARPRSFRPTLQALDVRLAPAAMAQSFDHVFHVTDGASLQSAVQSANSQSGTSEIILDRAGHYDLTSALSISSNITITGRNSFRPDLYVLEPASGVTDRVVDVTGAH